MQALREQRQRCPPSRVVNVTKGKQCPSRCSFSWAQKQVKSNNSTKGEGKEWTKMSPVTPSLVLHIDMLAACKCRACTPPSIQFYRVNFSARSMGDRSRLVFCDPMCDRNRLGPNCSSSNESIYKFLERFRCKKTLRSKLGTLQMKISEKAIETAKKAQTLAIEKF